MIRVLGRPKIQLWLIVVGASTLVLMAAYAMVQQSTRLSANDAPILESQRILQALSQGSSASDVIRAKPVELDKGYFAPFAIITDQSRHAVASSATIAGRTPLPPAGVFEYTKAHGNDNITWQPDDGIRLATHITTYSNSQSSGFIITGQSLEPYEDRVTTFTALAALAWLGVIAWTSFILLLPSMVRARTPK